MIDGVVDQPKQEEKLIDGVVDSVVLGEIVTRSSWHIFPVLKKLNKTWFDALTHRFPKYAFVHHILSNSLVIYSVDGLWVYNYARVLRRLPIPPIPENLRGYNVEFVLDDNYDSIFSFIPIRQRDGSLIYNVSMLDLTHGTMCRWTTLPSLQIRFSKYPIEAVKYPYTCSSFKTGNRICIKLIFRSWGPLIHPRAFSVWTLDGRNNSEWAQQWRCEVPVSGSLIQSFSDAENNTPFYVEIEVKIPLRGRTKSVKYLYHRCEQWRYTRRRYSMDGRIPEYILMVKNDWRRCEQPMIDFYIYDIKVRETYTRSEVSFHRAKLDDDTKSILPASNWNVFEDFWRPVAPFTYDWEAPRFPDRENNGRIVIQIVSNGYSGKK